MRRQQLRQPAAEHLQARRDLVAVRVHPMHRHDRAGPLRHHLHQLARLDVRVGVVSGDLDQPQPGQTTGQVGFGVVHGDLAAHVRTARWLGDAA